MEGYFTVVGQLAHYTFRIEQQPITADFAPGRTIIGHLISPDNYRSFGFIGDDGTLNVWGKARVSQETINAARFLLKGDMTAAGKMYALESGNCWRCGRQLTTPESILNGIGPTCAAKVGIARITVDEQPDRAGYAGF